MKIKFCDEYDTAIIEVSKFELGLIIGTHFGDRYGNHGDAFSKELIEKEYDLHSFRDAKRIIKVAHENKRAVIKLLQEVSEDFKKRLEFLAPEINKDLK
jgi:actin-like ATPase involved in cell morphogenesis